MKLEDIKNQLGSKQRYEADLFRFIQTRTDSTPNYTLLLGAGCSISSGIRPATVLCDLWRDEVISNLAPALADKDTEEKRDWLKRNEGAWYDPQKEYSTLFEKKYDLQRQRRMFVENEVKNATPSIGYAYLTALIDQDYFNTTFTTNFDDLLNEAFFLYSRQRPITCAHDSSINSVTVTSKRPKVIKLHGDYLFDDIKATDRETESLGQNMKEKFIEFAKDFGLVVVGYAGGDRSIIDTLSLLLKNEDYFKNGIYWCIRKGSDIPEDLRRLLWKDRVYFVEIQGFDELFAEMYSKFNSGECLPPATIQGNDRYEGVVKKLLSQPSAFPETTSTLKAAKDRLLRLSKRKTIANSLINPEDKDRPLTSSSLTDDELLELTHLQQLQRDGKHKELIDQIKNNTTHFTQHKSATQIGNLLISANLALRQETEALQIIEQLDNTNRNSPKWLLRKARLLRNQDERLKVIKEACLRDDESPDAFKALGGYYVEQCSTSTGEKRKKAYEEALEAFKSALKLDPAATNSAWSQLHSVILNQEKNTTKRNEQLNQLEDELEMQGTRGWRLLSMRTKRIDEDTPQAKKQTLISQIEDAKARASNGDQAYYDRLLLKIARQTNDQPTIKNLIEKLIATGKHFTDSELCLDICQALRKNIGDDKRALCILQDNFQNDDFDYNIFSEITELLTQASKHAEAEAFLEKHKAQIRLVTELQIRRNMAEAKGEYENALKLFRQESSLNGSTDNHLEAYYLLLNRMFEEAKKVAQSALEKSNYSPECVAEIVNFELAKKNLGKQPDNNRLDSILKYGASPQNRAVIAALRDRKRDSIDAIQEALRKDKTFRFEVNRWPVFNQIKAEPEVIAMLARIG